MSDGPHRSLKMRQGWKKLAERADNRTFEPEQITDAIPEALEGDWREEIPTGFLDALHQVFGDPEQGTLFRSSCAEQLEMARPLAAGKPLAQLVVDCAIKASADVNSVNPLLDAVENALQNHTTRGMRSVEEHYLRKSTSSRAQHVRARLEEASSRPSYRDLASRFLKSNSSGAPIRAPKQSGIDQGVRLP